jgi:predicted 3-demethylubiquinone-9 3-methyltransferase (glyoxalase superfamily)
VTQKFVPCLWFNDQAEQAVELYTSLFKNSRAEYVTRYTKSSARASGQPEGSVLTVKFTIAGQEFLALNGGPHFKFTQAASLFVGCETEKEIDHLWQKLSEGGKVHIPFGKHPWAEKYGWCSDRFGLSWQVMLGERPQKITPALLFTQKAGGRAEEAMKYYTSVFPNSKIEAMAHDPSGKILLHGRFTLNGEHFIAFEGPGPHDYTFNHAFSIMVNCKDQKEIDHAWEKLSARKEAEACGWLMDKFGVSWQIVPAAMSKWMADSDATKGERAMSAILKMKKINIAEIEQAIR